MATPEAASVTQLMSLSPGEFQKSILALDAAAVALTNGHYRLNVPPGQVEIGYAALPSVKLGGLLELPRANVTLAFDGLSGHSREAFLKRFEIAFQRGGG